MSGPTPEAVTALILRGVVVAWGGYPAHDRAACVRQLLEDAGLPLWCLGRNGDGSPRHPLYLPYSTALQRFEVA